MWERGHSIIDSRGKTRGLRPLAGSLALARAAGSPRFARLQVSRPCGRDFSLQLNEKGGAERRRHLERAKPALPQLARKRERSCKLGEARLSYRLPLSRS